MTAITVMKHSHKQLLRRVLSGSIGAVLSLCILTAPADFQVPAQAKTIAELDKEIKENEQKIKDKEAELASIKDNIAAQEKYQEELQGTIDLMNKKIMLVDTQLNTINQDITQKETDIDALEEDIANQQTDIDDGLEQFKKRLRAMYISGNDSLASALVGSTDFYDVLSKMDLISRVAKHDDALIDRLMEQLKQFEASQLELTNQVAALDVKRKEQEATREEYSNSISELNEKMQETDAFKAELEAETRAAESDIDSYKKENAKKASEQNAIAAEAKRQQEIAEQKRKQQLAQQQQQQSGSGSTSKPTVIPPSYTGGKFNWPVPGFYGISSYYGPRWGSFHAGIDIAGGGISGASVTAASGGIVTVVKGGCSHNYKKSSSCGCNGGYGNYVVVDHGNGYATLYAHLASISVSYLQNVSTGTVLGTVGSTGWSTGFHLHFGVMQNGSFVNPAPFLGV